MKEQPYDHLSEAYRHVSFLFVFLALTTYTLKNYRASIPSHDIHASVIAVLGVLTAVLFMRNTAWKKPKLNRTKYFVKAFQGLSVLETTFTLWAPHLLLIWGTKNQEERALLGETIAYSIADVLTPHLFILQVQILLEMLICLSDVHEFLLFPYTVIANGYRFVPIALWIQHARKVVLLVQSAFRLSWMDFLALYFLPIMALFLWVSSSFVFLPFIWCPLIEYPKHSS
jgi:hypothetical protein